MSRLDEQDFAQIYLSHRRAVFSIASATIGPVHASDVTQETFLRLWQHPERYDSTRGSVRSLLMAIARNVALDMARQHQSKRARERRYFERTMRLDSVTDFDSVNDAVTLEANRMLLQGGIGRLSAAQREAVLFVAYTECSYRQAARALGIAEGTFKTRIRSGLTVLRRAMSDMTAETDAR